MSITAVGPLVQLCLRDQSKVTVLKRSLKIIEMRHTASFHDVRDGLHSRPRLIGGRHRRKVSSAGGGGGPT